jgi:TonB family protein
VLNLIFDIKPTEGVDRQGKKFYVIEVADCDCPFDFTYKIDGFELQDPSFIRVNGLKLSELHGPLVEEIQGSMDDQSEVKDTLNQIFTILEEPPKPIGGMSAFYQYVHETMQYPPQARKMLVEGRVFCEFVVNRDGSIQDVRIIRGIGAGCDEEAIRIIQASPQWKPGKKKGKPVRSKFNVAIVFKLR